MIATTRPFTNQALYTGLNTSAGPPPRASIAPPTSFPRSSGQRIPNTRTSVQLVGKQNRRIAAPRRRGAALTP